MTLQVILSCKAKHRLTTLIRLNLIAQKTTCGVAAKTPCHNHQTIPEGRASAQKSGKSFMTVALTGFKILTAEVTVLRLILILVFLFFQTSVKP